MNKSTRVPDGISTIKSLIEWWDQQEKPTSIFLSKNSLLLDEIWEFNSSNPERWTTFRGVPIVYEQDTKWRIKAKYKYLFAPHLEDLWYDLVEQTEDGRHLGPYDACYFICSGYKLPDLLIWVGGEYEMAEHESVMEEFTPDLDITVN